jgi:hypothetical protein
MWTEAFSYGHRPGRSAVRGVVTRVDLTLHEVHVRTSDGAVHTGTLSAHDCTEAFREVALRGAPAVRVECDVSEQRVVRILVMVQPDLLQDLLERGAFRAEEWMIQLARAVWRDASVRPTEEMDPVAMQVDHPPLWNATETPFAHQTTTVAWMRRLEAESPKVLTYPGNLHVTRDWYLDTEGECFTRDASPREAQLAGGICADGTGTGKTATALRLIAETSDQPLLSVRGRYDSNASLVILPLNLVAQWGAEIRTFLTRDVRVVWLTQAKDLRDLRMETLLEAHIVVTTFHFLRTCKTYTDAVEGALGGRPRTRAALSAWRRQPNHCEPVLEAVGWRRVVVDEMHETFEKPTDLRQLRLFSPRMLWGLTATPALRGDQAQHLYSLLCREKPHHPNLLATLLSTAVRTHSQDAARQHDPTFSLQLVHLEEGDERTHVRQTDDVREVVHRGMGGMLVTSVEDDVRAARERERAALRTQVEGHERTIALLQHSRGEWDTIAHVHDHDEGPVDPRTHLARDMYETHTRNLESVVEELDRTRQRLGAFEATDTFVNERLATLESEMETCSICMARRCAVITPCAHLFCEECVRGALAHRPTCPTCRADLTPADLTLLARRVDAGSKMDRIGQLLLSLQGESVILFVQWKSMVRGTKTMLRSMGLRVLLLDGNLAQRASTLHEFRTSGVLLLCLEDGFAGLHLPHARHLVFAHAIVAERDRVAQLERQAIARCVRTGQTSVVTVYSFVIADCAEEALWRDTHAA